MSSLARASGKDEDAGVGDGDWVGVDEGLMAKTMMRRTPAPRASRASRGAGERGGAEVGEEQLNRSGGSTNRRRDVRASTFIFEISELFLHAPRSELRTAQHRTRETRAETTVTYSDRYMYAPSIFTIYLLAFHPDRAPPAKGEAVQYWSMPHVAAPPVSSFHCQR